MEKVRKCTFRGSFLETKLLWIDICKPGYTLARICYEKMNAYKEKYGKDVQVLLLQNHGIFVAANTVEEIGVLFDGVITRLRKAGKKNSRRNRCCYTGKRSRCTEAFPVTRTCGGGCSSC